MKKVTKIEQLTKRELAKLIESHHLYTGSYNSKNYYKYSSYDEIKNLMKQSKVELIDFALSGYDFVADENGNLKIVELSEIDIR